MSQASSPCSPTTPRRRLSSRRGSVSASDPYAKHAEVNLNPNRSSFSTLTIVKVLPTQEQSTISLQDPPVPGQKKFHRRRGSVPSEASTTGAPNVGSGSPRLSFAFSSFGGPPKDSTRSPSPSSPRLRSASPHRGVSSHRSTKPRPTPEQLYDLAHHAVNPKYFPSAPLSSTSHHAPESHSPRSGYFPTERAHSPHGLGGTRSPRSPILTPSSSALSTTSGSTMPATFTPLPPSVYLPFIDRPSEVAALIASPPTKKLFALLSQTFPKNALASSSPNSAATGSSLVDNPDPSSSPDLSFKMPLLSSPLNIPSDPVTWSFTQLLPYLTTVTRDDAPDLIWAAHIRKCIFSRSELIWERVKGALGVPPELDVDFNLEDLQMHADVFEESSGSEDERGIIHPQTPRTDDMEDLGRKVRGHWDDWDAIMDSPVYEKHSGRTTLSASSGKEEEFHAQIDAALRTSLISPTSPGALSKAQRAYLADSDSSQSGESTISPTPVLSSTSIPTITQELPTPKHSQDAFDSDGRPQSQVQPVSIPGSEAEVASSRLTQHNLPPIVPGADYSPYEYPCQQAMSPSGLSVDLSELSIEPLYAPSATRSVASPGANPPPLSLPAALAPNESGGVISGGGLGDIMEGEEEEEVELNESQSEDVSAPKDQGLEKEEESKANTPTDSVHIHGLRISLPSSPSFTSFGLSPSSVSSSPVIGPRSLSRANSEKRASGSFSLSGLARSGSMGSIAGSNHSGSPMRHVYSYSTSDAGGRSTDEEMSDAGYDPVGDRAPGNPLFPSNFARLATGPTLAANNPSLRSHSMPPQSKYQPQLLHAARGNRFRRGSGATSISNDFAITLGSASSIGGESAH